VSATGSWQNREAFAFVDQLLGSAIHFETAGSLYGGRRVWVLATLPVDVEVGGDTVRPYVLLMNSHDGSTSVVAATTPIRVVTGEMRISVWPELGSTRGCEFGAVFLLVSCLVDSLAAAAD
jgi:hypothetical protein